jgi:hypothetical protein
LKIPFLDNTIIEPHFGTSMNPYIPSRNDDDEFIYFHDL